MSDHLLVSTRKGLFVLERARGAWQVACHAFLGDNVALALADPRDGRWYAALDLGHFGAKLQVSEDQGRSWRELAVPAYAEGDVIYGGDGKDAKPATLQKIWALEAGGADQPGRLWCGTIPGGLFRSDDGGASWRMQRALWDREERRDWFGGGYDAPGIHSICVDPRDSRRVALAISSGGVWRSADDGASWEQAAQGMRAAYMPPERSTDPNIQDVHHMVQCAAAPQRFWVQHHNGVFVSDADATQWRELDPVPPSAFGFAVAVHPHDPDVAWFVPATKDEHRVPVDGALVVTRTRDGGRSFEVLREGLPQQHAYDLVYRHALAVDRGGTHLAFGSTTGGLWTSADQGGRWRALEARLPPVHAVTFG
jgi:ligand-binding sensor domain-containing protein